MSKQSPVALLHAEREEESFCQAHSEIIEQMLETLPSGFQYAADNSQDSETIQFSYDGETDTAFIIRQFQQAAFNAGAKYAGYNAGTQQFGMGFDHMYSHS